MSDGVRWGWRWRALVISIRVALWLMRPTVARGVARVAMARSASREDEPRVVRSDYAADRSSRGSRTVIVVPAPGAEAIVERPGGGRGALGAGGDPDVALGERFGSSLGSEAAAVVGRRRERSRPASQVSRRRIVLAPEWRAALESNSRASESTSRWSPSASVCVVDLDDGARARTAGGALGVRGERCAQAGVVEHVGMQLEDLAAQLIDGRRPARHRRAGRSPRRGGDDGRAAPGGPATGSGSRRRAAARPGAGARAPRRRGPGPPAARARRRRRGSAGRARRGPPRARPRRRPPTPGTARARRSRRRRLACGWPDAGARSARRRRSPRPSMPR